MLFSPLFLSARRIWNGFLPARSLAGEEPNAPAAAENAARIILENSNHTLEFDRQTGRLISLRASEASDQEFIPAQDTHPVFVIQYLDSKRSFQQVASTQAKTVSVQSTQQPGPSGHRETTVTADFSNLAGFNLAAKVTVRSAVSDPLTYWSISVENHANLLITDVQFPFVVASYHLAGSPGSEAVLTPVSCGELLRSPQPQDLEPDSPHAWQFRPENGDTKQYPGNTFAQFLAYYNDRAGVLVACHDSSGCVKLIKPVHSGLGIRLGISHVGDWPADGDRQLEYPVVVTTFSGEGDWYTPAEIYRNWSLEQNWARAPLHKRADMPEWLLDSPPHIIVRIQGQLDAGPTTPNKEFVPYPKIVPLLDNVSKRINAPVVGVIMSWERPGPWIYPDCFPPVGGDESLRRFAGMMRDRGWHVGSFCNGTRWVVGHFWSDYDGRKYFAEHAGADVVCKTHHQELWHEWWDQTWRPSYACCLGVPRTREIARKFIQHLVDDGLDWVQFLDQNVGCATFPCYATDHGHSPVPGKWMTAAMEGLTHEFRRISSETETASQGRRRLAFSVEQPPNEFFMSHFQICDARVIPPGHTGWEAKFLPLYHFLYHEFVLIQGGFGSAPEPFHMPIRSAYNLVVGEIPGAVITGDGRLLNKDTFNWAPWTPAVGNNEDSLEMLRTTIALRRGPAKEYLVFGRMRRPGAVRGIRIMRWEDGGVVHQIPAMFHSAWQDPADRFGIVLANWTQDIQAAQIADPRLGRQYRETVSASEVKSSGRTAGKQVSVSLPPLSCALLEAT